MPRLRSKIRKKPSKLNLVGTYNYCTAYISGFILATPFFCSMKPSFTILIGPESLLAFFHWHFWTCQSMLR